MFFTAALAFYYQQDLYALCDDIKVNSDTPWILRLQTDLVATILQLVQTTYPCMYLYFCAQGKKFLIDQLRKKLLFIFLFT